MGCLRLTHNQQPELRVVHGKKGVTSNDRIKRVRSSYLFGMLMPGRHDELPGRTYAYGFQGQERDDEVKGAGNAINFKYRMNDPRLGRFFAVDPLAPKYPELSTYHFSHNSPIYMREIEGLEGERAAESFSLQRQQKMAAGQKITAEELEATIIIASFGFGAAGVLAKGGLSLGRFALGFFAEEAVSTTTGLPVNPADVVDFAKGLGRASAKVLNRSSDKTIVIGQGMGDIKKVADEFGAETFSGSKEARDEWESLLKSADGERLSDDVVKDTKMYKQNQDWIKNKVDEGYNVIDIGDNPDESGSSIFYEMEKETVYGGDAK